MLILTNVTCDCSCRDCYHSQRSGSGLVPSSHARAQLHFQFEMAHQTGSCHRITGYASGVRCHIWRTFQVSTCSMRSVWLMHFYCASLCIL